MNYNKNKPTMVMLVGLPYSGKSTWVKNEVNLDDFIIISLDKHIFIQASKNGHSYNQEWELNGVEASHKAFMDEMYNSVRLGKNVIIDQTNINRKARKQKLKLFKNYNKIAIAFKIPTDKEIEERRLFRTEQIVTDKVISKMRNKYSKPTYQEGFDDIIYINGGPLFPFLRPWLFKK